MILFCFTSLNFLMVMQAENVFANSFKNYNACCIKLLLIICESFAYIVLILHLRKSWIIVGDLE